MLFTEQSSILLTFYMGSLWYKNGEYKRLAAGKGGQIRVRLELDAIPRIYSVGTNIYIISLAGSQIGL